MVRDCDACGGRYTAKRSTSRYCSPRCRQRALRSPKPVPGLSAVPPTSPGQSEDGPLTRASLEALEAADVDQTPLGQAALLIARRLETESTDTGSSIAALIKVHREVLTAALELRKVKEWSPLEQIRQEMRSAGRLDGRELNDCPTDRRAFPHGAY